MGPPQEKSGLEEASEVEMRISLLLLMSVAVRKATGDRLVKATRWLMFLGVGIRLVEFEAIWLGADTSLQSIGEVVVYFDACKS